jgi:hypothetical protein
VAVLWLVAPTIRALRLDPNKLQAVQLEHPQSLPGVPFVSGGFGF